MRSGDLEPGLLELVKIRASQINGCTHCLAMHTRDARACGEHQTRLDTVAAWREAPDYMSREQAALAWREGADRIAAYRGARLGLRRRSEGAHPG